MITCIFIGEGETMVGDRKYDCIGQRASFAEMQLVEVIKGGGVFLPAKMFQKAGITAQELAAYGPAVSRHKAPITFLRKVGAAQQAFRELQQQVRAEGVTALLSKL